jgi:hypothetical protein
MKKVSVLTILCTLSAVLVFGANAPNAQADDTLRNLSKQPLNANEKRALRVSASLAKELNKKLSPACVNVSNPGSEPVTVQFFYKDESESGPVCGDPHYSIQVEFDEDGRVSKIIAIDS